MARSSIRLGLAMRVLGMAGFLASVAGGMFMMRLRDDPEAMQAVSSLMIDKYGGENSGEVKSQVARSASMLRFLGNGDSVEADSREESLAEWYAADAQSEEPQAFE